MIHETYVISQRELNPLAEQEDYYLAMQENCGMDIRVNGQSHQVPDGTSLAEFLGQLKLNRQLVAVEVNTELVAREAHDEYVLQPGDLLEIVTLVGGG